MKYMQTGGFEHHPLMRRTILWVLVFLAGLWATNLCMYFARMGLNPSSVQAYYLGSEQDFRPPRSAASMLEVTHAHLPIMGLTMLLLTHLAIFAPYTDRAKKFLISGGFATTLAQEASGWLVRFVHPGFAWLKVLSFLCFQTVLLGLIASVAFFLLARPKHKRHSGAI